MVAQERFDEGRLVDENASYRLPPANQSKEPVYENLIVMQSECFRAVHLV
jgi:hypothetical protein